MACRPKFVTGHQLFCLISASVMACMAEGVSLEAHILPMWDQGRVQLCIALWVACHPLYCRARQIKIYIFRISRYWPAFWCMSMVGMQPQWIWNKSSWTQEHFIQLGRGEASVIADTCMRKSGNSHGVASQVSKKGSRSFTLWTRAAVRLTWRDLLLFFKSWGCSAVRSL